MDSISNIFTPTSGVNSEFWHSTNWHVQQKCCSRSYSIQWDHATPSMSNSTDVNLHFIGLYRKFYRNITLWYFFKYGSSLFSKCYSNFCAKCRFKIGRNAHLVISSTILILNASTIKAKLQEIKAVNTYSLPLVWPSVISSFSCCFIVV